jgi:hypothetical protein
MAKRVPGWVVGWMMDGWTVVGYLSRCFYSRYRHAHCLDHTVTSNTTQGLLVRDIWLAVHSQNSCQNGSTGVDKELHFVTTGHACFTRGLARPISALALLHWLFRKHR